MSLSSTLDQLHLNARSNKWHYLFAIFCRLILAVGFIPPGIIKIWGERFTALANNHPMGNYLEALFHTGFYYPVIGVMQVLAGVLLLFPRTAILGAVIYFPIILNICLLSISVRFEGSFVTSPLMVCANLYLLCWYYHTWQNILPFNQAPVQQQLPKWKALNSKFPYKFFSGVVVVFVLVVLFARFGYELMPRNTFKECVTQCEDSDNPEACYTFCESIHKEGKPLNKSIEAYENAKLR